MCKQYLKTVIFVSLMIVFFSACTDKETNPSKGDIVSILGSTDYYTLDQIRDDWDNGSLNGVVFLETSQMNIYQIFTDENGVVNTTGYVDTTFSARAGLFNSTYSGLDVTDFVVNAYDMERYSEGKYSNSKPREFATYFGSGYNRILIDSNSIFDTFKDSVAFGQAINFTNITRDDTISQSNGYVVNWTSSPNATVAYIEFYYTDAFDSKIFPDSVIHGVSWYQENTGTIDLKNFIQQINVLGTFDLKITLYEPHYLNLSNNKQILVIGESSDKVTVHLKN